ncbi:hypothetical protein JAAARDRAFT_581279 [Jaapia argillacea MUCL 33604]|uniref:Uncharacterized protein n=1 Tax=Jaapia argillacea MUCL 33604 TaxID=933084 RepID=A0A067PJI3_9AGAM|nr:hypothetical protein JAAARDRAFT_581279 [Jaapia argillacea MUCL 33604]
MSICSYPRPTYRTDERSTVMLIRSLHPPITGYRFLVTITAVCFGLAKAVLSYLGYSTAPNTVDWVFGVLVTISLYWLGLYEASATEVLPALFETDYTSALLGFGFDVGYNLRYVGLHVIAFALFAGWTGLWLNVTVQIWFGKQIESDTDNVSNTTLPDLSQLVDITATPVWSASACVSLAIGLIGCGAVLRSFFKELPSSLKAPAKFVLTRIQRWMDKGEEAVGFQWLGWVKMVLRTPPLGFPGQVTRTQMIMSKLSIIAPTIGYLIGHILALLVCIAWVTIWSYSLVTLWSGTSFESLPPIWALLFSTIWSVGAAMAIGSGLIGTCFVLRSLIAPVLESRTWWPTALNLLPERFTSGIRSSAFGRG